MQNTYPHILLLHLSLFYRLRLTSASVSVNVRSFFFLYLCVYVPLVKLSHVPVSCKQGFSNPVPPRSPLPLISIHSPMLSNLHPFLLLTLQPFSLFSLKLSILFIQIPLRCSRLTFSFPIFSRLISCLRSTFSDLQLNFSLAPLLTPGPLFLCSKLA